MRRRAFRAVGLPQLDLFAAEPFPNAPPAPVLVPVPPRAMPGIDDGRWRWTRPWLESPHRRRARRELEAVRAHFPELDGVVITVGLTKRRNILGLASLGKDPEIWIRPRRIHRFALAHELVHLLQARDLVPGGEKTADLYALARSIDVIDVAPFYLKLPKRLTEPGALMPPPVARLLHEIAAHAVRERRGKTARGAVRVFERDLAAALAALLR